MKYISESMKLAMLQLGCSDRTAAAEKLHSSLIPETKTLLIDLKMKLPYQTNQNMEIGQKKSTEFVKISF